jgi:hypothetical protein
VTAGSTSTPAVGYYREAGDQAYLAIELRNLSECLGRLGDIDAALQAAAQAAQAADRADNSEEVMQAASYRGRMLMLSGDIPGTEEQFLIADRIEYAGDNRRRPPVLDPRRLVGGVSWPAPDGTRTGPATDRPEPDRRRPVRLERRTWPPATGCSATSTCSPGTRPPALQRVGRRGRHLPRRRLPGRPGRDAAHVRRLRPRRRRSRHRRSARHRGADPWPRRRGLAPAQSAALTARARIHAEQADGGDRTHLEKGRDAASTAQRLAVRHRLAWHELDALDAHARPRTPPSAARADWAALADALRARLTPAGLDPDPLATVEQLTVAKRAEKTDGPD